MIDSIDNNMAAPSGEADFSGAVFPEAEALTEAAAQAVPLPSLLGEDGGFVPDWYARFDESLKKLRWDSMKASVF